MTAANLAVFPSATSPTTLVVNGRSYTLAVGSTPIVVPMCDGLQLLANGWLASAQNGAGTTAQRPTTGQDGVGAILLGFEYYDSTVGATVIWNGKNWINHASGATA
jgi:hypothetical protein